MTVERKIELGPSAHWLDLSGPTPTDLEALSAKYNLHPQMVADCLDQGHLPKILREGSVNFLILRAYDESAASEDTTLHGCTRKIALFWGENFLITVHRVPMPWLTKLLDAKNKSAKKGSIPSLVEELIEETLYSYEAPIDEAAVAVESLEEEVFKDRSSPVTSNEILESAYLAKKRATIFKRVLRLTRDLLTPVARLDLKLEKSPHMQSLKDEADRLYYYADDLVETANALVELSISLTTNRTNEVVRMLTIVSLFILPLNVVTGIYGMNFPNMPEIQHPHGYALALLLMVSISAVIFIWLKKKGWIR